jgi:hypothetical protein
MIRAGVAEVERKEAAHSLSSPLPRPPSSPIYSQILSFGSNLLCHIPTTQTSSRHRSRNIYQLDPTAANDEPDEPLSKEARTTIDDPSLPPVKLKKGQLKLSTVVATRIEWGRGINGVPTKGMESFPAETGICTSGTELREPQHGSKLLTGIFARFHRIISVDSALNVRSAFRC